MKMKAKQICLANKERNGTVEGWSRLGLRAWKYCRAALAVTVKVILEICHKSELCRIA